MELEAFAAEAWTRIAPITLDREIVFDRSLLLAPPKELTTSLLRMRRGSHQYGEYLVDSIWCEARGETYGHVALWMLAAVFHDTHDEVCLALTHPSSDVRRIVVEVDHPARLGSRGQLRVRPDHLAYWPAPVERHPERFERTERHALPWLSLSLASRIPTGRDEERAMRDTVVGFGSLTATVDLAGST